ncbi:MAPEG family protein [Bradyrhizobium diazoefficiens]|nr:MAPEG family protein [Bradyrhizobium diazoefficiens]QQO20635.1 MAPEG family protein [Bradyrhizobium diazoefficiens]
MAAYSLSIVGVLVLCLLSILLAIYSGSSKGRAGALAGPVLPADDDNLLYRIDRVHMNAVEALPPFVVPAVLAMMVGVGPVTLATLIWAHIAIRLIHLAVYLRGGKAAKGGSIRTILYVSGALMTIILIATTTAATVHLRV